MEFDRNKLIAEIKNRPAIWDIHSAEYEDRYLKLKHWSEIADMYVEPGATARDKQICRHNLQTKWKNVRDQFIKDYRKIASRNKGWKQKFKHYKELQFLVPCIPESRRNQLILTEFKGDRGIKKRKTVKPIETNETVKENENFSEISTEDRHFVGEDPDRQFMLSLVQDFKRVPDRLKCIVKVNILKCIIEAQELRDDLDPISKPISPENTPNESLVKDESLDSTKSDKADDSSSSSD